jgi:SAM-dependent methyltransferase
MLAVATQKRVPAGSARPTYVQQDFLDLGFARSSFDQVVCSLGMHIGDGQVRALLEIQRVLRPGGRMLFSVPIVWSLEPFWSLFNQRASFPDIAPKLAQPARDWSPMAKAVELTNEVGLWSARLEMAHLQCAALVAETRVVWFRSAEEFFDTNPFGQVVRTLGQLGEDAIRARVVQDVSEGLEAKRQRGGVPITVTVLCGEALR